MRASTKGPSRASQRSMHSMARSRGSSSSSAFREARSSAAKVGIMTRTNPSGLRLLPSSDWTALDCWTVAYIRWRRAGAPPNSAQIDAVRRYLWIEIALFALALRIPPPPRWREATAKLHRLSAGVEVCFSDAPSLSIRKAVPRLREPSSRTSEIGALFGDRKPRSDADLFAARQSRARPESLRSSMVHLIGIDEPRLRGSRRNRPPRNGL